MSSEERQRREEEPLQEEPSAEEPREAGETFEPVEKMKGSEGSSDGLGPEVARRSAEEQAGEPLEEALPEENLPSEESLEITEDEIPVLVEELELARGELEVVRKERDEYLEKMRRMKAELENSRKRQERERARLSELAAERLVRELLPVVDNLERAVEAEGDIREGVQATRDQLAAALGREGLAPVISDGESFDPAVHEAVMSQPSDEHEEGTVIQTLERGYILNGKPIRPAKVVVAKQV